jgi:hypothetical protein
MAITVKHKFVSAIPDAGDTTIVQPSNWNDSHDLVGTVPPANGGTGAATLTGYVKGNGTATMTASATVPSTDITGLGTMSTQNANAIAVTGGTMSGVSITGYIPTTEKAVANGVATLDGGGTVPVSQLPAAVLGALSYQGTWNASTNTPTLASSVGTKGYYYVVNVAGSTNLNGIIDWQIGDWAVYNGSAWQKIDNTDAVTSVNGYTGTVVLNATDVGAVSSVSGTAPVSVATGTTTPVVSLATAYGDTQNPYASKTANYVLASPNGSAGVPTFRALVAADLPSLSGSYIPYTGASSAIDLNAQTVTNIAHLGINTTTVPTILMRAFGDNNSGSRIAVRGYSSNASSSSMRVTKFRGTYAAPQAPQSGDSLGKFELAGYGTTSSEGYPQASYEGVATEAWGATARGTKALFKVTPNTTTTQVTALTIDQDSTATFASTVTANGVLLTGNTGTVTSVAATAGTGISVTGSPITTSGTLNITNTAPDQTVVLTAGTGISTSGTYPNFTITNTSPSSGGTVTSVTGTAPVVSSGGNTPAISMAAANTTTNGYLTSTDWNTFNGKGSGSVTSVSLTAPSIFTVTGSPVTSSGTLALTYSGTALPILNGGTGQTTASAAFNALSPITTTGDLILGNGTNSATRLGIGANTYVLTSNGTTASWAAPSGGSSAFYTSTSFTATAGQTTFTVSYTAGQIQVYVNGVMLNGADYTATNGTSVVLAVGRATNDIVEMVAFTTGSVISTTGALVWQSVKTANFTAVSGNAYPVNTTSGAVTVTLPSSPAAGAYVTIVDYAGTAATNSITIAGNSSNIQGSSNNGLIAVNRQAYNFVYIDSTQGWISYAQEYSSASQPYTASYLVIAGGGGGGYIQGGGGGAGGLLSSTTTLTPATTYSFVIGAGGAGSTVSGTNGVNGVNTTAFGLTAIGGGGGGSESYPTDAVGSSGGSGGGGSSGSTNGVAGGSGTSGQGNSGGTAYTNGSYSLAGGGGGASAVGQNASAGGPAGTGGAGTASSITGSSVTYAGGGGGGADYRSSNNNGGAGGAGGGGAGAGGSNSYVSVAGTANTGGGGGGGSYKTGGIGTVGAAGGSGVVILSVPTASYSGTTTGSPTITTSGSNTIIKYTSSGSYTA